MPIDTTYYDALNVSPTASELEIKKAYRRLAIKLHPDKNPDDESAHQKFQAIGEAYQVLSDKNLRAQYDKYGKEKAVPSAGFEDPATFFSMIFGGEAFVNWIGELSLLKDITTTYEISSKENATEGSSSPDGKSPKPASDTASSRGSRTVNSTSDSQPRTTESVMESGQTSSPGRSADTKSTTAPAPPAPASATTNNTTTTTPSTSSRTTGIPIRPALMDKPCGDNGMGISEREKELRAKEKKKGGLTKEQREELAAYELERRQIRENRISDLTRKLVDKISVWTETDKGTDVTEAFRGKIQLEIENLKMESFGLEILHAIGAIYLQKATAFIKSQKFLGISGFLCRLKDKGTIARETFHTISVALDAQVTMEEMAKMEEKGGNDWTDEKRAEFEKKLTGKILSAAWHGSKMEIQSVLRDVCDRVLSDKTIKLDKRLERAQALLIIGELFSKAARDPDEEGEFMAFEQLMAEAAAKKEKAPESSTAKKEKVTDRRDKRQSRREDTSIRSTSAESSPFSS